MIILISSTLHAKEVFTTPIMTFEKMLDQHKISTLTSIWILSQAKSLKEVGAKLVKRAINQLVEED